MGAVETVQVNKHHKDEDHFSIDVCKFRKEHRTSIFLQKELSRQIT